MISPPAQNARPPALWMTTATLSLAHVADGRLDGFVELQLSASDVAAGIVLVRESGG